MDRTPASRAETSKDVVPTKVITEKLVKFLEGTPLYVKLRTRLPAVFESVRPEVLELHCSVCGQSRPFRGEAKVPYYPSSPDDLYPRRAISGVREMSFGCTGCDRFQYRYWVEVNYEADPPWVQKVGQLPIWIPAISKVVEKELGDDSEIFKKALRCMNEGYGIGACAYLRRLLEKHINPLLQLLYEVKADSGAGKEELEAIQNAIAAKDFTAKTEFAADISPASLIVDGHNPFKEIHERLSVGLHALDEETANRYAVDIKEALEYIIKTLRRTQEERRAYAPRIKEIRTLPTS